jgi:hypothetical protein
MPYTTYRSLPLEGLYDLLIISVVDLLTAMDAKKETAIPPLRNQIEILLQLISEKKNAEFRNN